MSMVFTYADRRSNWSPVNLGNAVVRLGTVSLASGAYMGGVESTQISFDDVSGNLGHSGDQIVGLKALSVTESDCSVGGGLLYFGYIGARTYEEADSLNTGVQVRINATVGHLNQAATFYVIDGTDGNRPAETVGARLTWLLGSTYNEFYDNGFVIYPTTLMDAADYRNQTSANVLDDCAQTVSYNWWLYYDTVASNHASLWFDDPNTSTTFSSTLRLSNVLADVDSTVNGGDGATHTWAPIAPILTRDPSNVISRIVMPYAKGTYVGSRSATADTYGRVDQTAAASSVKTSAKAAARVARLLSQGKSEEDLITCSVELPKANVNDCREGYRIQAKFRQLPGYKTAFSWFRIVRRTVNQHALTDQFYTVDLTLSPQSTNSTIVQTATERHQATVTFGATTTVGNLLLYMCTWRQLLTSPRPPVEETWTQIDMANFIYNGGTDNNAIVCYATIVTTGRSVYTKQGATGGDSNGTVVHSVMYEIAGAVVADIASISKQLQAASTTLDIGALTDGPLQIGAWGNGYDGFTNQTTTPGVWIRDFYSGRDESTTSSNTLYYEGFPGTWYGHVVNGVGTEAQTSIDTSSKWGGIAVTIG